MRLYQYEILPKHYCADIDWILFSISGHHNILQLITLQHCQDNMSCCSSFQRYGSQMTICPPCATDLNRLGKLSEDFSILSRLVYAFSCSSSLWLQSETQLIYRPFITFKSRKSNKNAFRKTCDHSISNHHRRWDIDQVFKSIKCWYTWRINHISRYVQTKSKAFAFCHLHKSGCQTVCVYSSPKNDCTDVSCKLAN